MTDPISDMLTRIRNAHAALLPTVEKLGWVREAAGDRFSGIELCQTRYDIAVSDSPAPLAAQTGGPPIPKRPLIIDQAVAALEDERARYGFSYIQISDTQLENFAPVVARLAGK